MYQYDINLNKINIQPIQPYCSISKLVQMSTLINLVGPQISLFQCSQGFVLCWCCQTPQQVCTHLHCIAQEQEINRCSHTLQSSPS